MSEKKFKKAVFICELKPEDEKNFDELAKMLRLSKSAAIRTIVALAVKGLREGREEKNGTTNR